MITAAEDGQTTLKLTNASSRIRDYTLAYSSMDIRVGKEFTTVFPRTGFLIFSFITGTDFVSRFVNYDQSVARPNHLYICGLLSQSSLIVRQTGTGGGYAMKIHPVIGYYLLRQPMSALVDRQIRLCNVIADNGSLLDRMESTYHIDSFDHPEMRRFLRRSLPPKAAYQADPIYHAVNEIAEHNGIVDVHRMARRYFMSERTFHRQFLIKVGLPPKAYAKIWQIRYAMELIKKRPDTCLEQISYTAGYYDVAHLARDFKAKVSLPPSRHQGFLNPLSQQYLGASPALL
ncbi:helix-turn-helix domain-containing protein [Neolewinella sp.]|uniref:AraC family transcriptional regulator n=1 Tax=Neolewinella sp. TaxID=2993543 RepID=UPI003B52F0B6